MNLYWQDASRHRQHVYDVNQYVDDVYAAKTMQEKVNVKFSKGYVMCHSDCQLFMNLRQMYEIIKVYCNEEFSLISF